MVLQGPGSRKLNATPPHQIQDFSDMHSDAVQRRKIQNRDAQRRYRENIKRRLEESELRKQKDGSDDFLLRSPSAPRTGSSSSMESEEDQLNYFSSRINPHEESSDLSAGFLSISQVSSFDVDTTGVTPGSGSTMLHLAAQQGFHTIIEILLQNGISITTKDDRGQTCLHTAAMYGHADACLALLNGGIDVDSRNDEGQTALFVAVKHGQDAAVKVLLDNGADVHAKIMVSGSSLGTLTSIHQVYSGEDTMMLADELDFSGHLLDAHQHFDELIATKDRVGSREEMIEFVTGDKQIPDVSKVDAKRQARTITECAKDSVKILFEL
ncbi:hypothetical protein PVAG01_06166 [Phlyctema vagabunda]|uniref:BZIP domain-containing protein n=1 Tax=Phlyctema vagabunda TaxID=108571 RepID=A0ABR4PFA4_9HELO